MVKIQSKPVFIGHTPGIIATDCQATTPSTSCASGAGASMNSGAGWQSVPAGGIETCFKPVEDRAYLGPVARLASINQLAQGQRPDGQQSLRAGAGVANQRVVDDCFVGKARAAGEVFKSGPRVDEARLSYIVAEVLIPIVGGHLAKLQRLGRQHVELAESRFGPYVAGARTQRASEHRATEREGVVLAILTSGIDRSGGDLIEETLVDDAPHWRGGRPRHHLIFQIGKQSREHKAKTIPARAGQGLWLGQGRRAAPASPRHVRS